MCTASHPQNGSDDSEPRKTCVRIAEASGDGVALRGRGEGIKVKKRWKETGAPTVVLQDREAEGDGEYRVRVGGDSGEDCEVEFGETVGGWL